MRRCCLGLLSSLLLMHPMLAAQPGVHADVVGGTLPELAKSGATLDLLPVDALVVRGREQEIRIPYAKVENIEYGQNVSRRYVAAVLVSPVLLLSKSRKHYVTMEYTDAESRHQVLIFRVGKGDIRGVLAALEARSGRRVEYQDNEARKAGQ